MPGLPSVRSVRSARSIRLLECCRLGFYWDLGFGVWYLSPYIDSLTLRPYLLTMFELVSPYQPAGDQPQAIAKLIEGLPAGAKHQTLLGVTGSGKTFTVANVIKNINK